MFLEDKTKNAGVTVDPFSLDALIAWLRGKDAEATYCYRDNGDCLVAQYLKERCDYKEPNVGGHFFSDLEVPGRGMQLPGGWSEVAIKHPRTFGAALSRALAIKEGGK